MMPMYTLLKMINPALRVCLRAIVVSRVCLGDLFRVCFLKHGFGWDVLVGCFRVCFVGSGYVSGVCFAPVENANLNTLGGSSNKGTRIYCRICISDNAAD